MCLSLQVQAAATFERALELGVRYFDVAPSYGAGLAEMRIGRALRRAADDIGAVRVPRSDVFVNTPISASLRHWSVLHCKCVLLSPLGNAASGGAGIHKGLQAAGSRSRCDAQYDGLQRQPRLGRWLEWL